jgi:septal ring factor EnvC (AmiA/AmiB activator)
MEAYGDTSIDTHVDAMPPIPGAGAGDGADTMRMLREFEQRMATLESRLDEVTEAKERLERQVAAQTEELRVQRAAIARTQRALRNLSRPDDESPTEPALRDPNA